MSLIKFKNKPDTSTAINAENLNNNFSELNLFKNIFNPYGISNSPYASYDVNTHKTTLAANSTGTSFYTYDKFTLKKDKTYTLSIILDALSETATGTLLFRFDVDNSTVISNFFDVTTGDLIKTFSFTPSSDITPNRIGVYCVNAGISFLVQIEENSESTPYKPSAAYIVESGSNNNGSWIKYGDGNMICFGSFTVSAAINTEWGSLYSANISNPAIFPITFESVKSCVITIGGDSSCILSRVNYSTTGITFLIIARPSSTNSGTYTFNYQACGRWK